MNRKVGIIGVGHVGAAVAEVMVMRHTADQLILIDKNDKKAKAEQYDLTDQQAFFTRTTAVQRVAYETDWHELADCNVLIFSAGNIAILTENPDRLAELKSSAAIVRAVAPKIRQSGFKGILISITNPCDVVVTYLQQLTGIPKQRIFGTGTTMDTARMKHAVAVAAGCAMQDVQGFVLGEHGESQFTAWSTVSVGGLPIRTVAQTQGLALAQLEKDARMGAWYVISGKGFTSFAIGQTATTLTEAVLGNAQQCFPLSSFNPTYQIYIGQVTRIGAAGIVTPIAMTLNSAEQAALANSAQVIRTNLQKAQNEAARPLTTAN